MVKKGGNLRKTCGDYLGESYCCVADCSAVSRAAVLRDWTAKERTTAAEPKVVAVSTTVM